MKYHLSSSEQVLTSLHSARTGLSAGEALRRAQEFGLNRIEPLGKRSILFRLIAQFTHFFALLLWGAAGCAFIAEWLDPGQGMGTLGLAVVLVIVVNGVFSFWQEYRAERAIAFLLGLLPSSVKVLRDGMLTELPAESLVPGDVVRLGVGDKVPADMRVIECTGVRVDESILTGESLPVPKSDRYLGSETPGELPSLEFWRFPNILPAGALLVAGRADAVVFATGMQTEFGRVVRLTEAGGQASSPLQREIAGLSRIIAALSIAVGGVFFFLGRWVGVSFSESAVFAIGIIVANVPEGLLPTVTLALAMAGQRMAKRNAVIRHLPAVEALGAVSVICTDKTGTLTLNELSVAEWAVPQSSGKLRLRNFAEAESAAYEAGGGDALDWFATIGLNCHDLEAVESLLGFVWKGDPLERSLVKFSETLAHRRAEAPTERRQQIPFDSDRKRLTTLYEKEGKQWVLIKGAAEVVSQLCAALVIEGKRGETTGMNAAWRQELEWAVHDMAQRGLRVLALAFRSTERASLSEERAVFVGLVGFADPPRTEVPGAISRCQAAGIRVVMVTGDHPDTAVAVARKVGLCGPEIPYVLLGSELRRLSPTQLQLALDVPQVIFARLDSTQKVEIVRAFQRKGHAVAVTGDGVNDAPALKVADVGVAMGKRGTDVAREAADIVLSDDNFATIVAAIEEGRAVFKNIRKFLSYILTSNIPELVPYLLFVLIKIPLPLTILQILAVDLGTDLVPALALGAEPPRAEAMGEKPRRKDERLANRFVFLRAYLFLGIFEAIGALAAYWFVLMRGGWNYGESLSRNDPLYLQATTACLTGIVVMQIVNLFVCRSDTESAFKRGEASPLRNRLLFFGIAFELVLIGMIVYMPGGQWIFGTAAIDLAPVAVALPFGLLMLLLDEARKAWVRRKAS